jgi:hypothetical protein
MNENDVDTEVRRAVQRRLAVIRSEVRVPPITDVGADRKRINAGSQVGGASHLSAAGLLALALAAAIGLVAVPREAGRPGATQSVLAIPHVRATEAQEVTVCNDALQVGELRGSTSDPRVLWMVSPDGSRTDIDWPIGFAARFAPTAELIHGALTVAREGDSLRLSGGFGLTGVFEACNVKVP